MAAGIASNIGADLQPIGMKAEIHQSTFARAQFTFVALCLFLVLAARTASAFVFTDHQWFSMGDFPDVNGSVNAIAVDGDDQVYVGGEFNRAGILSARHIARWDPHTLSWTNLGDGLGSPVNKIVIDSSNAVYACGGFTNAGSMGVKSIAKWDPVSRTWDDLDGGLTGGNPTGLAVDEHDRIVVAGSFTNAGGVAVFNFAVWDPVSESWSAYAPGLTGTVESIVFDQQSNLYVAGVFRFSGTIQEHRVARWSAAGWTNLAQGISGEYQGDLFVADLAIDSSNNLYACGAFTNAGGIGARNIAKWTGDQWTNMGAGLNYDFSFVVEVDHSDRVYVGGFRTYIGPISYWNGTYWVDLPYQWDFGYPLALAFDSQNELYSGGFFYGRYTLNVEYLFTTRNPWVSFAPSFFGSINAVVHDSSGNAYVGGSFKAAPNNTNCVSIAKWDVQSRTWTNLGSGMDSPGDNQVVDLIVDSKDNLYAAGYFWFAGGVPARSLAKWDGNSWTGLGANTPIGVYAMTLDNNDNLYVAGDFGVMMMNTNQVWTIIENDVPLYGITDLVIDSQTNIFISGFFSDVYWWNAASSAWQGIGDTGWNSRVFALAVDDHDNLYAGGGLYTGHFGLGIPHTNFVMKRDAISGTWSNIGLWPAYSDIYIGEPTVRSFAWDNQSNLIVGADGNPGVAIRIGDEWHTLGSAPSPVLDVSVDASNNVFAVGIFSTAGGKTSLYAAWAYLGTDNSDYDGDEIPDYWETTYYGSFTNALADALASNGMNTVFESYMADLNPTNPVSVLPQLTITDISGQAATLELDSSSTNRIYDIELTMNLMNEPQEWIASHHSKTGIGSFISFVVTNDLTEAVFRAAIKLP